MLSYSGNFVFFDEFVLEKINLTELAFPESAILEYRWGLPYVFDTHKKNLKVRNVSFKKSTIVLMNEDRKHQVTM